MAFDPTLAARIRTIAGADVQEKKLFGGLGFLVNGNLAASAYKDGGLMIRCAAHDWPLFTEEAGARPMLRKGNPVSGWVLVAADDVANDSTLIYWVQRGLDFAAKQPSK
jgi:hypothetical protein